MSSIGAQGGRKPEDPAEAAAAGALVNGAAIESLGRMLESVPAPLFALDRNRQVVAANVAAGKLFGGTITGRNLLAFLRHPPLVDAVEACEAGRSTEPVALPESQGRSGQRRLVARLQAIRPPMASASVMVLIEDTTAAERALTLRRDFVANVSHELKTPIAALLGFIETLMGPARDDPLARQRFLGIMRGEAERMNRLVSELLSLSRIEMNEHQPPAGRADLGNILKTVRDSLTLKVEQRQLNLVFPGLAELPTIPGDPDELTQAIQNLVDNAIKYSPDRGEVRVGYQRIEDPIACREKLQGIRSPKAMIALSVSDQGEGIAKEHIPRLTERFYRVDAARSRELGGTGLGLAIVKHIVNRHRGSLDIDSEPGKGSTFTLFLPVEA
ncbi:ATP-binding protein [Dongia sedimenti]|uniref:histidine kinase n=1 Tax=Dongia sedimenti TaxID=3064282 RepID=A0ABU0YL69_9PROT|nr:ATP-binding protein [Rhodospirillaceae bacterium R-7]